MCGQGVGLGLFPSDSLESQSYDFHIIAQTNPLFGVERLHKVLSNRKVHLEKSKKSKIGCFLGHFWTIFGFVSQIAVIRF